MPGSNAARQAEAADDLYGRIGAFLARHRLSAEPDHYAFAFHVVSDEGGALAKAVASLTDGGVRLTREDIESLGGEAHAGRPITDEAAPAAPATQVADTSAARERAEALVADTRRQVDGFADMVSTIHDETRGFGRDLAASAVAIERSRDLHAIDEIARITGAMLERVRAAEQRLESATRETGELRRKLAEAQGSARRDPLTDLPNRRALEEAFAARAGEPLCVALCDVDHFKQVNDRFGHAVGDRVLTVIGQTLAKQCGGHLVARFGGEEFAVLLATGDVVAAQMVLDEARGAIAARRFRLRESDTPLGTITLSVGVGCVEPGDALGDALRRADRALYEAKAAGRNRVIVAAD